MGDVRFERAFEDLRRAQDRRSVLDRFSDETLVGALAAAARTDPYLANVLATEAMNRVRRKRTVLEHVADGVVELDAEGLVEYANPAAERLLGWPEGALAGERFHDAVRHRRIPYADLSTLGDETVSEEDCSLLGVLRTRAVRSERDHDVFTRRDGRAFVASFTAAPVVREDEVEGLVVIFRDDTDARREEERVGFFEAAARHAPVGIYWVQKDGRFAFVNEKAAEDLGLRRDDLAASTVFDVDRDMRPEAWPAHWARVRAAGAWTMDTELRHADGRSVPVRLRIRHVELLGREYHVTYALPRDA